MTNCKFGRPDVSGTHNICTLGHYGGKPSDGVCQICPHYQGPARGLGDRIDKLTTVTGIKAVVKALKPDCGCPARRVSLNERFPSQ